MQVVILPVVLGLLIQSFFPGPVKQISSGLPLLAALGASLISASVLAQNRDAVLLAGPAIIICVFLLHAGGFAIGFLLPQAFGIPERMRRTMSIEVRESGGCKLAMVVASLPLSLRSKPL